MATPISRPGARALIAHLLALALFAIVLALAGGALANEFLPPIPAVKPPPSAAKLPLQNRFLGLDRRYQALHRADKLRLSQQRNAIGLSVGSPGSANTLDAIELGSQMDRLSQRLSSSVL